MLSTYHAAVADEGLFEIDLLLVHQLLQGGNLANLLEDVCLFLAVAISGKTLTTRVI